MGDSVDNNATENVADMEVAPLSSSSVTPEGPYILVLRARATLANFSAICLLCSLGFPSISHNIYTLFRLVFGNLYPAYASYKAVKTKNVKEYVRWMMYWIVFALFTCVETITDVFLSFWFPFYYELKIVVVLWLLSPATRGSSILYRQFVHPTFTRRENEIDECITRAKEQGYTTVLQLGTKGMSMATSFIMQTAFRGGGELMSHLRRTQSLGDLGEREGDVNRNSKALPGIPNMQHYDDAENAEEIDYYNGQVGDDKTEIYFPEVDVPLRRRVGRPREKGTDFRCPPTEHSPEPKKSRGKGFHESNNQQQQNQRRHRSHSGARTLRSKK